VTPKGFVSHKAYASDKGKHLTQSRLCFCCIMYMALCEGKKGRLVYDTLLSINFEVLVGMSRNRMGEFNVGDDGEK
jgi:hypothetical protein